jgi:putative ABC transport system permease protein
MFDVDKWQEIFNTLQRHKLRTLLTAFGVFWGIFMLVLLLGVGKGLEQGVYLEFRGIATNSFFLWGGRTSLPYKGLNPGRYIRFSNDDIAANPRTYS